jgi:hypothetical protein
MTIAQIVERFLTRRVSTRSTAKTSTTVQIRAAPPISFDKSRRLIVADASNEASVNLPESRNGSVNLQS